MEYVANLGNQTRAYMKAYPNASYDAARAKAPGLVAKASVKQAIDEKYKKLWAEKDSELEKSKTFQMIKEIGNSNVFDIVNLENNTLTVKSIDEIPPEAQNAIQSIEYIKKNSENGTDENIKVKLHSKLSALELRAKMQGMLEKEGNSQVEIVIKPAVRPTDDKQDKPKRKYTKRKKVEEAATDTVEVAEVVVKAERPE